MYVSVVRLELVCLINIIMVTRSLNIWQIDFVSAFLNSENSFEIYMKQPKDFEKRRDEYI